MPHGAVKRYRASAFFVTLYNLNYTKVAGKLNRTQEKLLQVLRESPEVTTAEMANIIQMSPAGIRKNLSALRDGGYIERVGSRKTGSWKVLR
jgi:predicted HTH transcriptional regulator